MTHTVLSFAEQADGSYEPVPGAGPTADAAFKLALYAFGLEAGHGGRKRARHPHPPTAPTRTHPSHSLHPPNPQPIADTCQEAVCGAAHARAHTHTHNTRARTHTHTHTRRAERQAAVSCS